MTDKPAGWYTDPSGMPNMFRWWDGRQWTTTLTSDPGSPAPVSPSPVTPPGESGSGGPGSSGESGGSGSGSAEHQTVPISQVPPPQQPGQSVQPGQPGQPVQPGAPQGQPAPGQAQPGQGQPGQGQPGPQPPGVSLFAPPSAHGQPPPVPPPPGAPGPGYVPPPYDPMRQYTEVLSSGYGEAGNGGGNRKALMFGGIGLAVVLIAAIIGGVWWFNRDDNTPTASDNSTQQPQQTEPPSTAPTPDESLPNSPDPRPTPTDPSPTNIPSLGQLTFTPLPRPWESSQALSGDLLQSTAQVHTTETNWDGEDNNWVALVSAGYANPTWVGKDGKDTAGKIAAWFAKTNFNGAQVGREPLGTSQIKVSGNTGVLLKEHFTYSISGLKAKGETVYIAVIDIKGAPVPGVFLGSVPDTNKALQKDVEKAIDSLKVES